jgi:hypothetical protein
MKTKPKSESTKSPYEVIINSQILTTWATSEQTAISNAAYRYGTQTGDAVALVLWKIKNNELEVKVKKI